MTGRKWTDPLQEAWLKKHFPSFLQADSTAMRKTFFASVCTEWQKKWPDPEPSSDELTAAGGDSKAAINIKRKAMDKRIKAWFDNHKRPTLSGKMDASISGSHSVLNLSTQRAWQPWQAYSALKYKDWKSEIKIQFDALKEKWDEGHTEGEKKPNWFTFQNAFLKEKLEGESDEMKAMVEEHRLKMLEVPPDEVNRQYQIAIDKLPLTFATVMDNIAKQTGWNIMIIAGGPRPNDEGRITTLTYTTGKTKDGQDFKEFLGEKLELMEGAYDDFLHECFLLCDGEHNGGVDDDDENEREKNIDETSEETESPSKTKNAKAKGKSKNILQRPKSDYEIEREKNIAENRAILATIRDPEFEAAMGEVKKGPVVVRKKNKSKPSDVEERRTSARLSGMDTTSKSTNEDSALNGKDAEPLRKLNENAANDTGEKAGVGEAELRAETEMPLDAFPGEQKNNNDKNNEGSINSPHHNDAQIVNDTGEKPEGEAAEPVSETKTPAGGPKGNKNDSQNNNEGSLNSLHRLDAPADRPASPGHVDHDGDVTMRDGSSHESLTRTPESSLPSSANVSPTNASSANQAPAVTTSSSTTIIPEPLLQSPSPAATSQDGPAPAGSASLATGEHALPDGKIPGFLTPAIIAHLRGVSSTATWQQLVTAFLRFETSSPPIGKLSTTARPPEVAPWIRRHINKKHHPVTVSDDYGVRFRAWWTALQPSWRITSSAALSRATPPKETWGSLKKGGSAGLYVVVMALSWWVARLKTGSDDSQVMQLVDDLSWVLSLVTPVAPPSILRSMSVKRRSSGSSDDEEESSPPKRVKT